MAADDREQPSGAAPPTLVADAPSTDSWGPGPSTSLGDESLAPVAAPPTALNLKTDRYDVQEILGAGGQGTVYRAFDHELQRPVAMKVLRATASYEARLRFDTESALTIRLQHPGIVAVFDRGATADGRPWYTMPILEGAHFGSILADPDVPLRRRLDIFVRACEAVAYAHQHGVTHRDLKPQNIMIGAFGEVRVLDWGLARAPGARLDGSAIGPATAFEVGMTRTGALMGTPRYMAPEQLARDPDRLSPATDVYALGLILAHVISGAPPAGRSLPELIALRSTDLPPPASGPEPLRRLCAEATRHDPRQRPPRADALADAVRVWLDGAEKRAQAAALVEEACALEPEIGALRDAAEALEIEAAAALDPVPSHAPIADKRPGWALSDRAATKRREARLAEVKLRQTLQSALRLDPESAAARAALTAHYRAQLLDAEAAHDSDRAAEYEALLLGHDRAANVEWLRGDGKVTLFTDPPGAEVEFLRYEEQDRRLVEVPLGRVEAAPLVELPLAMGSYLLKIRHPGRVAVRYPVNIARHAIWDGIPPGEAMPYVIPLPAVGEVGEDECYVPAGWCVSGGDPDAMDPLPASRVWVNGFVIERDPVTHRDVLAWLDGLLDRGQRAEADRWAPRQDSGEDVSLPVYRRTADGRFALGPAFGVEPGADWPAVGMTWAAACALLAARGRRLPDSWQWEKAARGVDGRLFPWGDHFDPNWANTINSRPGRPAMGPVGQPPGDVGPYGVRGLAGNVRELCGDVYRRRGPVVVDGRPVGGHLPGSGDFLVVKGGSYGSGASTCRVAGRFGLPAATSLTTVGFRGCRDW